MPQSVPEDGSRIVIGLDIEYQVETTGQGGPGAQPRARTGQVDVIQIATLDIIYVFKAFLTSDQIIKAGRAIKADLQRVAEAWSIFELGALLETPDTCLIDLGMMAKLKGKVSDASTGLAALSAIILQKRLSKADSIRCSQWSTPKLTDAQKNYAALDVYANKRAPQSSNTACLDPEATRLRGANGYLNGVTQKPVAKSSSEPVATPTELSSPTPSPEEWDARDAWLLALITYNTKNPIGLGVNMEGSAAEAWKSLTDTYDDASDFAAADAERTLRNTMYAEGTDFSEHIKDLRTKWKEATEKGALVPDKAFKVIILDSLPEPWNVIASTLYSVSTSSIAISRLTLHWDRLRRQNASAGTTTTVLQTRTTSTPKPKSTLICVNSNCGRTGHTIENCYWKGGGKEGQFPANFRNRGRTGNTATTAANTTAAVADAGSATTANIASTVQNPSVTYALSACIANDIEEIYSPDTKMTQTLVLASTAVVPTFADSGASDHCFVDRGMFTDYMPYAVPRQGQAANKGSTFNILGQGTVKITVSVNGATSQLIFRTALHTPELAANLVSIAKFDEAGHTVSFAKDRATFTDPGGRTFMVGEGLDGMYRLDIATPRALVARSQSTPVDLDVWHRRFGHASVSAIRELAQKGLVDGLNIKGGLSVKGLCEDCVYGKHTARPYDGVVIPESEVNHRAHFDLWGPAMVISMGGASYMMLGATT
ncbi:hypothetical protein D9615_010532 [Tricholomella constricta]|uniref:3'-5' exonuclease n=1 Tax=Tricholomella constricta TaxID=117010 RepID=A0A8H5GN77_9AGAR|nr:hypothetical protein D9615_010532 [Tricholomella constricta]